MLPCFTPAPVPSFLLAQADLRGPRGRQAGEAARARASPKARRSQAPARAKPGSGRRPMRSCLLSLLEGTRRRLKTMDGPSALPPNHVPTELAWSLASQRCLDIAPSPGSASLNRSRVHLHLCVRSGPSLQGPQCPPKPLAPTSISPSPREHTPSPFSLFPEVSPAYAAPQCGPLLNPAPPRIRAELLH